MGDILGNVGNILFGESAQPAQVGQYSTMTSGQTQLLNLLTNLLGGQVSGGTGVSYPYSDLMTQLFGTGETAIGGAGDILSQIGLGVEPYSGQMAAGASDLQNLLFGQAGGLDFSKLISGGQTTLDQLLQPYDSTSAQQYWETAVKDPALKTWEKEIIPTIQEKYAGLNAGQSGALNRAITKSGSDLTSQLGETLASLLYSGEQSQLNRQAGLVPTALSSGQSGLSLLSDIGTTQRGIAQEGLTEDYTKWQSSQDYSNPWLNYLGLGTSLLGTGQNIAGTQQTGTLAGTDWGNPWLTYLNTILGSQAFENVGTSGTQASGGLLSALMPTAGTAIGTAIGPSIAAWFSDERLKTDIQHMGKAADIPIISFVWNKDLWPDAPDGRFVGVLAQDLLVDHPEMVGAAALNGRTYLTVDYGQINDYLTRRN